MTGPSGASTVPSANLYVIQHTDAEYLGLIEDHLEGRGIRFHYLRPHTGGGWAIRVAVPSDGLILLGGGPWGTASAPLLPTLQPEVELARGYLEMRLPVIGFGTGAQILAIAAGGRAEPRPLAFRVARAHRLVDGALSGALPESFPSVVYGRDRAMPPADAEILAEEEDGGAALFAIGDNAFGFAGHPGIKSGIVEDYVMASDDTPEGVAAGLEALRAAQAEIADSLSRIMVGLIRATGWMRPAPG